ncbi:MAG TPA: acyl-CoA dehydrogenase family protein, partial [Terrimesophilobacter sp.]|nr:acyl-CoA dehydrogenase family protein [Terrimesophilobacter sp.]
MHLDAEVDEYLDVATGGRTAVVDVPLLTDVLLGRWRDAKLAAREYTKRPELHKIEGMPYAEHRERVLEQLKVLADLGASKRAFPEYVGGGNDHGGNLAAFEELITADPSVAIKGGVQWGLFGAAILHLGTRPHHEQWLPDAMSLAVPGAFAMTEIGHGSDVASIGTTATYDVKKKEFFIHTPFRAATKEFLGNAALHAQAAVVFAQLITQGVNHGVHAFYVPVRG